MREEEGGGRRGTNSELRDAAKEEVDCEPLNRN